MEHLRNLFKLCFSLRGTLAPREYIISSFTIFISVLVIYLPVFLTITFLYIITYLGTQHDFIIFEYLLMLVTFLFIYLPIIMQLSLAARRLRDAGRSLGYILLPLTVLGVCVFLYFSFSDVIQSLPPYLLFDPAELRVTTPPLISLVVFSVFEVACLVFGLFKRQEEALPN